jgi:ABC-2 type transport system permease protein
MTATADARRPGAGSAPQISDFHHYRQLTLELAISQFKLRYTQSVLGYVWSLLKPAMLFGVTYFIFVDLFKINDGTQFYGMQVLLGIVVWTFFAECTGSSMGAIAGSAGLIRKAYFPRSIVVIAASLSSLFTFLINMLIVFAIAVLLHQIDIGLRMLIVIPLLLELYVLALGLSLFLASLHVQFHDVGHLWDVLLQVLFYGSGVMFSLTYVLQRLHYALAVGVKTPSPPRLTWIIELMTANPITQIIEDLRHALLAPEAPWTELVVTGHLVADRQYAAVNAPWLLPVPFLVVIAIFICGSLIFRARARYFAENL